MSSSLSKKYLNRQFSWAALGFLAALIIMFFACWHSISRFMATAQYDSVFSRLLAENVRLETELTLILSGEGEPSVRDIARLRDAYRNLAGLYWVLEESNGHSLRPEETAAFKEVIAYALGPDVALDDLLYVDGRPLVLAARNMPSVMHIIWDNPGPMRGTPNSRSLSATVFNILEQVGPIVAERAEKSAPLEALMAQVLNQEFPYVRPFLREMSQLLSEESDRNRRQVIAYLAGLIVICIMAGLVIWRVIFTPLTNTILEAQDSLQSERDKALQAERAKADFLAVMSHELRTPMNAVIGFSNLLVQSKLDTQQREFVQTILGSSEALLSILNDVLDFSKIEAGKIELERENFSIVDIVGNAIDLMGPSAYAKNLELLSFVDPTLPQQVSGDAGRLRQILFNLVGNAVKFTGQGSVTVTVGAKPLPATGGPGLEISVADTGIGIPKDAQAVIFDRFTQADNSTTRRFGGTGLGLSISRRLTDLMGGRLTVESESGEGSTFRVHLPLLEANPPADTIVAADPVDLSSRRVLIVDDNPQNRHIFELVLKGYGAETVSVQDAGRAMARLMSAQSSGGHFDAVVIDHMMPDVDGVELARMIRRTGAIADVPLVLSSSAHHTEIGNGEGGLFDGVCSKPIRQKLLIRTLDECMRTTARRGPAAAAAATASNTEPNAAAEAAPIAGDDELPDRPAAEDPPPQQQGRFARVLLADDHVPNQRLISAFLGREPYSIDMANDGVEAVQLARTLPYDVILMDVNMPEMSGIEATERIRKSGTRNAATPIIAVTANVMPGDRDKYIAAGMDDYITKPITLEVLKERLETWSKRRHEGLGMKKQADQVV